VALLLSVALLLPVALLRLRRLAVAARRLFLTIAALLAVVLRRRLLISRLRLRLAIALLLAMTRRLLLAVARRLLPVCRRLRARRLPLRGRKSSGSPLRGLCGRRRRLTRGTWRSPARLARRARRLIAKDGLRGLCLTGHVRCGRNRPSAVPAVRR
jgi:hypothetical protein